MVGLVFYFISLIFLNYAKNNVDTFGNSDWWSNVTNFNPVGVSYPKLQCNTFTTAINLNITTDEMMIYQFYLTSGVQSNYRYIVATTCCINDAFYSESHCDPIYSLDSVMYLVTYNRPKGSYLATTELVAMIDDDYDGNECNDTTKSTIDLSEYDSSMYYIGISGWGGYDGLGQLNFHCYKYSYPPTEDDLLEEIKQYEPEQIECNDHSVELEHQSTSWSDPVKYYNFTIDEHTAQPLIITTCNTPNVRNGTQYLMVDSYLYLLKGGDEYGTYVYRLTDYSNDDYTGNDYECTEETSLLDLSDLVINKQYGSYYIAVGGYENYPVNYTLSISCGIDDSLSTEELIIILSIFVGLLVIGCCIFCCFYCRQLRSYKQQKNKVEKINVHLPQKSDNIDDDDDEPLNIKKKSVKGGNDIIEMQPFSSDGDVGGGIDGGGDGSVPDIRGRTLSEADVVETPDMDMIIALSRHIIQCAEDEEGFDVYQVLAFRRLNEESHKLRLTKPLSKWGINYEILEFSPYNRAWFIAVIVFLLQVVGITVILYSVTYAANEEDHLNCYYEFDDWKYENNWMFKILAFLWALVITFNIGSSVTTMRLSGFTQCIERLKPQQYASFDIVDLSFIEIGFLINLYTLLMAVFGSYFIVFTSSGGADAIDMVLNAVALFFMIELDDMLVRHGDYEDIHDAVQVFLKLYLAEKEKNINGVDGNNSKQSCSTKSLKRLTSCVEHFEFIISTVTIIGGIVAPLWIIICYNGVY